MTAHLGTDIALSEAGDVVVSASGDVQLVTGRACLAQDLALRLGTPRGGLLDHLAYGCDAVTLLQSDDADINRLDLQLQLEESCRADPRVDRASATVETWGRDSVRVRLSVWPLDDDDNPLNLVIGYGVDGVTTEVLYG